MRTLLNIIFCCAVHALQAQSPEVSASASSAPAFDAFRVENSVPLETVGTRISPHGLSAKLLFVDHPVMQSSDRSVSNGIDLAYRYRLNELLTLVAPLKLGLLRVPEQIDVRQPFVGIDATAQAGYDFLDARLRGYLTGGVGVVMEPMRGTNVQLPLGIGAAVRVGEAASLAVQYEYRVSTKPSRRNMQIGFGVIFDFGRGKFNPKYWDTDGDGVMDDVDACINVSGLSRYKGCPDTDSDGVHDAIDPCPLAYSAPGEGGCPDRDKDGVPDPDDACPDVPGDLVHMGCPPPDLDGDGFPDEIDECPGTPGKLLGCPDSDSDGIPDATDLCPKQAGPRNTNGCPDRDNDGFADIVDNCPLLPGELNGCPDRDKDGVDDGADRCPNIAGEAKFEGCPEIMSAERSMFEYAVRALVFESGSTVIDANGYENLIGLAEILVRYPEYRARLTGHADFEELVLDRTRLSEQRASACASFLVSQGISPERLEIEGVGAGRPIVRTDEPADRGVNRRVEIDLWE